MSWTVPIVAIGVALIGALTFIVVRGELQDGSPWAKFAEDHDLTFEPEGDSRSGPLLEGTYRGREVAVREITIDADDGTPARAAQLSVEVGLPPALVVVRRTPGPLPPGGLGEGDSTISPGRFGLDDTCLVTADRPEYVGELFETSEVGERIAELLEAQPRLAVDEGRICYWDPSGLRDRRELRRYLDRVVESAAYIERGLLDDEGSDASRRPDIRPGSVGDS